MVEDLNKNSSAYKDKSIAEKVDDYLNSCLKLGYFSGSVLIAKDNRIIVSKGYGMANLEHNIENTPKTKFRIASLTKTFTAMAIVMLKEKGLLSFNDTLSKYLPDYPDGDKITIHQLLTHSSGIFNFTVDPDFFRMARLDISLEKLIDIFKDKPLDFEPGTKACYSNSGYTLLAFIIEIISGGTYESFLNENIFKKLNMLNTGCDNHLTILKDRASGYTIIGNEMINTDFINTPIFTGGFNLYSTVEDLYMWDRALYSEKLVSYEALKTVFTPYIKYEKSEFGYGWYLNKNKAFHNGWINGFCGNIARITDKNASIIVLSNQDMTSVLNICKDLELIIFGKRYKLPQNRKAIKIDSDNYPDFVGQYKKKDEVIFEIILEDGRLYLSYREIIRQLKLELFPESDEPDFTIFFTKTIDLQVCFKRDITGKVNQAFMFRQAIKVRTKRFV
jgi:CubicO group peptidase (beta-lactamase class C family)